VPEQPKQEIVPDVAYLVRYDCEECGEEMVYIGEAFMSRPPQHGHMCKNNHVKTFFGGKKYPHLVFRGKYLGPKYTDRNEW
jgi:hypothetical protein